MPEYTCKYCHYTTKIITHYNKHLNTKKHIALANKQESNNIDSIETGKKRFSCKYCNKSYKYSQGLSKHIKYSCPKNKDEDLKELVRLLNEKNEVLNEKNEELKKVNNKQQKQIIKLSQKLQIQNVIGNQYNGINNNINLLNHRDTTYDFLTDRDYIKCIKSVNHCVKDLIEKVHFNENHPENMNIYVPSMKTDYLMMYKDNNWSIVDRKKHLDTLYELNEVQLENWYDECKDKYPGMIRSFKRYLSNKESSDVINDVKKEIIFMLYNNKKIVTKNSDDLKCIETLDLDHIEPAELTDVETLI